MKSFLFECFGDIIVENIKNNIKKKIGEGAVECVRCKKYFLPQNNKHIYCKKCAREINIQKTIENRNKNKLFEIENIQNI